MGKIKVGVLIFTDKVKDRMTRKNNYFDSLEYCGLKYIINEIDKNKYNIEYCSSATINNYEYVIVSLISYFDIFNFISQLKNKTITTKIIIGGATVTNIRPLIKYIYAACFGRGETLINDILECKNLDNVWYKEKDPFLLKKYKIGQVKKLIKLDNYIEKSVGCPNKCKFCQYAWKHIQPKGEKYNSGMDNVEELFKFLDWNTAKSRAISAFDGTTEQTRKKINKNLTNDEILKKLIEVYNINYDKPLYLKIFNIIGFSWEDENINFNEISDLFKQADRNKKTHKVWVKIFNNHFKPMPLTPLAYSPVSKINYREIFKNKKIYMGNNFEVVISPYSTSPATSIEETIINRAFDSKNLENIYTTKKYLSLDVKTKIKVVEKYDPQVFMQVNSLPSDYLISPYNIKY
jgi:radical SAM superfamily enzyme YgiQ (UPF0313 family)